MKRFSISKTDGEPGRCWYFSSCGNLTYGILEEQKKEGCPICTKKLWSLFGYASLFINETRNRGQEGTQTTLSRVISQEALK